jgi:hypothetical protein
VPWSGKPYCIQPPFLHSSFVGGGQPTTVKGATTVNRPLLAVLVNEPHSVGVATMVNVKGWVGKDSRVNEHVTVFPLVVHPAGSTESTVNPASGSNVSTRGMPMMQLGLSIHRSVMVKVIGSPTVAVLGAVLSNKAHRLLCKK